jgi:hypothetical protein
MLINENVLDWTKEYNGAPFHAMLCDPPYELGFMSKQWDNTGIAFQPETWAALAQHLHPGAFIMAFASTRGFHRQAVAMEDAGLIMHPFIAWSFASGFPKATRIDTQIEKDQPVVGSKMGLPGYSLADNGRKNDVYGDLHNPKKETDITQPATPEAQAWVGHRYGRQALKPAIEPILVFQKPYAGRAVDCITETGAGALNIEQSRIGSEIRPAREGLGTLNSPLYGDGFQGSRAAGNTSQGRWPANLVLQHSPGCECVGERRVDGDRRANDRPTYGMGYHGGNGVDKEITKGDGKETIADWRCVAGCPVKALGEQSGERNGGAFPARHGSSMFVQPEAREKRINTPDTGTAARFFKNVSTRLDEADPFIYQAKASRGERESGLQNIDLMKLRDDLTEDERVFVISELEKIGVV